MNASVNPTFDTVIFLQSNSAPSSGVNYTPITVGSSANSASHPTRAEDDQRCGLIKRWNRKEQRGVG
ncbi:hypothetical protein E1B28_011722 [Marasmius oreades]|uniref:Uncharacterized protein n=1 Tax=Marasmius oreades TaxID=181124 RepID=A0A9P7UQI7_9AGAR|nr:uncharacterized protein E1B28_011722 [Marasmius oreades]KAG7090110.1 hypothetical protein E1B28_011722 [Marasmius oreades]